MSTYWGLLRGHTVRSPRRRTLSLGPFALSVRGSALVAVMGIITAVLLVGVAIFILGHSEGDVVEYAVDDSRAFYIAEGGLERARAYLTALEEADPNANPIGQIIEGSVPGGGSYSVEIAEDANPYGWLDAYEVVSTGEKDGVLRQVKATVIAETFAIYQWFIGSTGGGFSWFRTGERFEGPVHLNGNIDVDGDPWFGGIVRAGGHANILQGSNPTFERGYEEFVEKVDLPSRSELLSTLRAKSEEVGGKRFERIGPQGAYWKVELQGDHLSAAPYDKFDDPIPGGLVVNYDFAGTNGVIWFDDDIELQGVLDGEITIGVDGDVHIVGDVTYADSTPGNGPGPNCDDVLGVIAGGSSRGNIIIDRTDDNMNDCELHGVFMALQNTIEAEDYQHYQPRGDLILYGGLMAQSAIHIADYNNGGVLKSGYYRNYHYDSRVMTLPPPFFPFASNFSLATWEEVVPVVVS
ncbi:MAG TPA: DUF4900 domain-containing protein [bacterium]|nr:DUF4900 domain-containing protein [bacterium]